MIIEFRATDIAFVLVFIIIDVFEEEKKTKNKNMFDFLRVCSKIKESEKTQLFYRFFSIFFL